MGYNETRFGPRAFQYLSNGYWDYLEFWLWNWVTPTTLQTYNIAYFIPSAKPQSFQVGCPMVH